MASILIIEDEAKMRRLLELNLGEQGFTTHAVADAEAGLKLLNREKIDLVVTDFRLPGMSGLEFLQEVKRVNAALPVVVMTAYGSVESAVCRKRHTKSSILRHKLISTVFAVSQRTHRTHHLFYPVR